MSGCAFVGEGVHEPAACAEPSLRACLGALTRHPDPIARLIARLIALTHAAT